MRNWYLIYSKPRQEQLARENLARQDYETYLPLIRQRRRLRGRYQDRIEAMFPRYLFIHLDDTTDNWKPIRSTFGVASLVCFGGVPARVPEDLVRTLKQNADADGLCALPAPALQRGERVRIVDGALAGYEAVFEARTSRERVTLLLEVAGRTVPVRLNVADIEATQ